MSDVLNHVGDAAHTGSEKDASYCHSSSSQGRGAFGFTVTEEPAEGSILGENQLAAPCLKEEVVEFSNRTSQVLCLKGFSATQDTMKRAVQDLTGQWVWRSCWAPTHPDSSLQAAPSGRGKGFQQRLQQLASSCTPAQLYLLAQTLETQVPLPFCFSGSEDGFM